MSEIKLLPTANSKIDHGELVDKVRNLLYEVRPRLKVVEALGILELAKHVLLKEQDDD